MSPSRRRAVQWLRRSIRSATEEADRGAPFSNFGSDLDDGLEDGVAWELKHDREIRTIFEYADSYFLAKAHGDPNHAGTPWWQADQVLAEYLHRFDSEDLGE